MSRPHRPRKRKPTVVTLPPVIATVERIQRLDTDAAVEVDPTGRQRLIAAPLDRLLTVGFLDQREHDAGDKLRADAYLAAIDPGAMSVDWSRTGGGFSARVPTVFSTQEIANARLRHRRVRGAIHGVVWDTLWFGVIKECDLLVLGQLIFKMRDAREAVVAGRAGLRIALASLADFYERGRL